MSEFNVVKFGKAIKKKEKRRLKHLSRNQWQEKITYLRLLALTVDKLKKVLGKGADRFEFTASAALDTDDMGGQLSLMDFIDSFNLMCSVPVVVSVACKGFDSPVVLSVCYGWDNGFEIWHEGQCVEITDSVLLSLLSDFNVGTGE